MSHQETASEATMSTTATSSTTASTSPTTTTQPVAPSPDDSHRPKVAIIGAGISGLGAAHYLHSHCDITIFEAAERIGGHTATVDVATDHHANDHPVTSENAANLGKTIAVDTGFIVFNDKTYPLFQGLMDELGVSYRPTSMGFSFCESSEGYEYSGEGLKTLFGQRKNLLNLKHWRMLLDIVRFNRRAQQELSRGDISPETDMQTYLSARRYGRYFIHRYLVPMAAAIWSKSYDSVMNMSALFFVRFFEHHGLLNIAKRPQWFVIDGGSREYLKPLIAPFSDRIRTSSPVTQVTRSQAGVSVTYASNRQPHVTVEGASATQTERFDQVVFACHADQALRILRDKTDAEERFLASVPYRSNQVVLHKDISILPKRSPLWASWNYFRPQENPSTTIDQAPATLTYNMNILQGFLGAETYCVTLNGTHLLSKDKVLQQFDYAHPQFSIHSVEEQARWRSILASRANGEGHASESSRRDFPNNTWFCGAWCRNGFHEDGLNSAYHLAHALLAPLKNPRSQPSGNETSAHSKNQAVSV